MLSGALRTHAVNSMFELFLTGAFNTLCLSVTAGGLMALFGGMILPHFFPQLERADGPIAWLLLMVVIYAACAAVMYRKACVLQQSAPLALLIRGKKAFQEMCQETSATRKSMSVAFWEAYIMMAGIILFFVWFVLNH